MISLVWSAAQRWIAAGALVRLFLGLRLDLLDLHRHLVGHVVPHVGDDVGLGLLHGEAGDALKHLELALLDLGDLRLLGFRRSDLARERLALFLDRVGLAVQGLLLLLKAALLLLQLGTASLFLPLVLGAAFVYFFLCLNESFSLLALGALDCVIDDLFCLFLGVGDLLFGVLLARDEERGGSARADDKADQDP